MQLHEWLEVIVGCMVKHYWSPSDEGKKTIMNWSPFWGSICSIKTHVQSSRSKCIGPKISHLSTNHRKGQLYTQVLRLNLWNYRSLEFHTTLVKFIYPEKATKFCKISTLLLTYVVPVKSKVDISQDFVAFSEHMNLTYKFFI